MEGIILLDTSALIDFLCDLKLAGRVEEIINNSRGAISTMTVFELFNGVENKRHIEQREKLLEYFKVLDITKQISRKAAEIYTHLKKQGKMISNNDILIGATAWHWKYQVLTNNKKDFSKIQNISLI